MTNYLNEKEISNNKGNGNNNGKKEDSITIETKGKKFDTLSSMTLINYSDLASSVNELFKSIFRDYYGCQPIINGMDITVMLQFIPGTDNGSGEVDATERIVSRESHKSSSEMERLYSMLLVYDNGEGEQFDLTADAKALLSKFIHTNIAEVNWKSYLSQNVKRLNYQSDQIVVNLNGLDMNLLMSAIFEGDSKYSYRVELSHSGDSVYGNNSLFKITRNNDSAIFDAQRKYFNMPLADSSDFVIKA